MLQILANGVPVIELDSESEISDDEDPDYCPGGVSHPPGNPTLLSNLDQSDTEDPSCEFSEEESDVQITSNRIGASYLPPRAGNCMQ